MNPPKKFCCYIGPDDKLVFIRPTGGDAWRVHIEREGDGGELEPVIYLDRETLRELFNWIGVQLHTQFPPV